MVFTLHIPMSTFLVEQPGASFHVYVLRRIDLKILMSRFYSIETFGFLTLEFFGLYLKAYDLYSNHFYQTGIACSTIPAWHILFGPIFHLIFTSCSRTSNRISFCRTPLVCSIAGCSQRSQRRHPLFILKQTFFKTKLERRRKTCR